MICPNCSTTNRATARFCRMDGTPLPPQGQRPQQGQRLPPHGSTKLCPNCGNTETPDVSHFCDMCGNSFSATTAQRSPVQPTPQRRPQGNPVIPNQGNNGQNQTGQPLSVRIATYPDPPEINQGESIRVSWVIQGGSRTVVRQLTIGNQQPRNVGKTGPQIDRPNQTTTYTIYVEDDAGDSDTDSITVIVNHGQQAQRQGGQQHLQGQVNPNPPATPMIQTFNVTPLLVNQGEQVTISWDVAGLEPGDAVRLSGRTQNTENVGQSGQRPDYPRNDKTYALIVYRNGVVQDYRAVSVGIQQSMIQNPQNLIQNPPAPQDVQPFFSSREGQMTILIVSGFLILLLTYLIVVFIIHVWPVG